MLDKQVFPTHSYFSLEDPDTASRIMQDPRSSLEHNHGSGLILDEFQHEPIIKNYFLRSGE